MSTKILKLINTCRTCAKNSNHEELIPLFPNGAINDIHKYQNTIFQVSQNDGLPQQICGECLDQFNDMNEFIQKCEQKQLLLEKQFNIIKIDKQNLNTIDSEPNVEKNICVNIKNEENLIIEELLDDYDYENDTMNDNLKIEIISDEKSMEIENKDDESNALNYDDDINDDDSTDITKSEFYDEIDIAKELQKAIKLAHENELEQNDSELINTDKLKFEANNGDADSDDQYEYIENKKNRSTPDSNDGFCNDFSCELCTEKNMSFSQLQEHIKYKHKRRTRPKSVMCEMCGEVVKDNKLKAHMNDHLGIPNETKDCEICGKIGLSIEQFKAHLYKHDTPTHKCENCRKGFRNFKNLQIHYQANPNKRCLEIKKRNNNKKGPKASLKCLYCMKKFLNTVSLVNHCQTHRKPDIKDAKHICNFCNTVFKRADHLKIHINSQHLKTEEFKCQICDKICYASFRLNVHMRNKHLNVKTRPKCEFCNKTFYNTQCVRRHQVEKHSTEKLYKCPICGDSFSKHTELKNHSKIHDSLITNDLQKEIILKEFCPNILDNSSKKSKSTLNNVNNVEEFVIEEADQTDNYAIYEFK